MPDERITTDEQSTTGQPHRSVTVARPPRAADHDWNWAYHLDQYDFEFTCGVTRPRAECFVPPGRPWTVAR